MFYFCGSNECFRLKNLTNDLLAVILITLYVSIQTILKQVYITIYKFINFDMFHFDIMNRNEFMLLGKILQTETMSQH